jgi:hypothetical protein
VTPDLSSYGSMDYEGLQTMEKVHVLNVQSKDAEMLKNGAIVLN